MGNIEKPYVFVSYVREDRDHVERLCTVLKRNGVEVWLDHDRIRPGERWQIAIRRAIEEGAFFIACFSSAYATRAKSYMNIELAIAVEELRQRPTDRAWFIPILFEGGTVPDRPIGGGETLRDIQWVDLCEDWESGVQRVMQVVRPEISPTLLLPERRHLVLMVVDLVGSAGIAQHLDSEDFGRLINLIRTIWLDTVTIFSGLVARYVGDGMVASFEGSVEAIHCGLSIQERMSGISSLQDTKTRIGVAAGQVLMIEGDPHGIVLNLAARICSLAAPGQILVSESARPFGLRKDADVSDLGLMPLKGFPERVRILEIRRTFAP